MEQRAAQRSQQEGTCQGCGLLTPLKATEQEQHEEEANNHKKNRKWRPIKMAEGGGPTEAFQSSLPYTENFRANFLSVLLSGNKISLQRGG